MVILYTNPAHMGGIFNLGSSSGVTVHWLDFRYWYSEVNK